MRPSERITVIGNWDLCLAIVNALVPPDFNRDNLRCQVCVLTYPSQTLSIPRHVSRYFIEHKTCDFTPQSLREAFAGQDLVISTMFGGDFEMQVAIIDAMVAAGVKRFIPHEFGQDTLNEGIQERIPKYAARANVLQHLENNVSKSSDFDWKGIATGYTLDSGIMSGDLGFDMKWHSATVPGAGTEPFAASSLERIGQVVRSVIQRWDQIDSHYIYAAGVVTTANEVVRCAEQVTRQQWTVGNHNVEDSVREGESRIERGFPDAGMALLERSVLYDKKLNASAPFRSRSSNLLLQLEPESVETIVENSFYDLQTHGKPGCACSS